MKKNQTTFLKLCLADALIQLMDLQPYETISVHAICDKAGIGRTTYYRHLDKRTGKEDLIVFKVLYDQKVYNERHADAVKKTAGMCYFNSFMKINDCFPPFIKMDW